MAKKTMDTANFRLTIRNIAEKSGGKKGIARKRGELQQITFSIPVHAQIYR